MIHMATATTTAPAKTTTTAKGRAVTPADKAALVQDEAAVIADIRAQWAATSITFATADDAFEAAKLTMESVRVELARIAFKAAMVHPFKGEPNLNDATKMLYSQDYGNAAENKKVASKKNTLRPYLLAGIALDKAGLAERTTAPAQDDRDVVNKAFDAYNREAAKARKAASKAAKAAKEKGEVSESTESTATAPAEDEAMSFADILAFMARANNALDVYVAGGGIITESDVDTFNAAAATMAAKLEELIA
ncbi:hypothetical protein SEA_RIZWANA_102 [Arthrobacter phage Rizwana]|nr:hypothetical protein SEA_RIZWANA_102 [Arthrobacter phage Rizwana]